MATKKSNTVIISGNLPMCVKDMTPVPKSKSFISVDKVKEKCHPILPKNIDWSKIDNNSWFMCIRPDNDYSYQFPIAESENRENDFLRAKLGMAYFHKEKYLIYQIQ